MATQQARREATRAVLISTAKTFFGEQGFSNTTIDQIAAEAGLAKGAVYHHFATKKVLFESVLETVAEEIALQVQGSAIGKVDILEAMRAGIRTFFAVCSDAQTARIFLADGPAVLGWQRWREIDSSYFAGIISAALGAAIEQGVFKKQPVEPLACLVMGAISEAALDCAVRPDFDNAAEAYITALEAMLAGLIAG